MVRHNSAGQWLQNKNGMWVQPLLQQQPKQQHVLPTTPPILYKQTEGLDLSKEEI
jgi:hypothetical protein